MSVIKHQAPEFIVANIAARNALVNLMDGAEVTVQDATADAAVGGGKAIYHWNKSDSSWILASSKTSGVVHGCHKRLMPRIPN